MADMRFAAMQPLAALHQSRTPVSDPLVKSLYKKITFLQENKEKPSFSQAIIFLSILLKNK